MYPQVRASVSTASFAHDHLEPIGTREATKRMIEVLYTDYNKVNLPEIIKETCKYLSSVEQSKLLRLLIKYEGLFDRTLGEFQTNLIKFGLQLGATGLVLINNKDICIKCLPGLKTW